MLRFTLAAALVLLPLTAVAQEPTQAEMRAACGDDYKAYCNGVQPGGGRIVKCLTENKDKISAACRKMLKI